MAGFIDQINELRDWAGRETKITFVQKWMDRIRVESLRIFVEGQNLFTIDGLPQGIDPESPGVNNGYYPQQRLLMGGITLTF